MNIVKALKVTFQTTLRDPQMHKILRPSLSSKLENCFALNDTFRLENSHQIWIQKEDQWFTKKVDNKMNNGILQKPAMANVTLPP